MANNLRKFDNEESYNAATLVRPAVSWIVDTNTVKFDPIIPTPPSFDGKYKFTLTDDSVVSGECDSSSAITFDEISAYRNTLKEVIIGDCVANISDNAFLYCGSLTSCTIGNGVTRISEFAFNGCSGLTSITVEATTPPSLSPTSVFNNTNNCPIYVPSASVDAYKAASRWSTYADRIQAIP